MPALCACCSGICPSRYTSHILFKLHSALDIHWLIRLLISFLGGYLDITISSSFSLGHEAGRHRPTLKPQPTKLRLGCHCVPPTFAAEMGLAVMNTWHRALAISSVPRASQTEPITIGQGPRLILVLACSLGWTGGGVVLGLHGGVGRAGRAREVVVGYCGLQSEV